MPQIKQAQLLKEDLNHSTKAQPIIALSFNSYIILNDLSSHSFRGNFFYWNTDTILMVR